jgi:DNA-binding response OmpR family regulator
MRTVTLVSRREDALALVPQLQRQGFSVAACSPEAFAERADTDRPAAFLLDLRDLPQAPFDVIRSASRDTSALLILVGAGELERLPARLDVDDFVVMPADPLEVQRRLERALWRRFRVDEEDVVRCGALAIDLANYRVTVAGEPVVLTYKEYELLRFLAVNAGRVFTREQLLSRVWGYDYFGGARTVDVHIRRIRAKIEVKGHRFIETVRNVGYRLVPAAQNEPPAE